VKPTPSGVPVAIISAGRSVIAPETQAAISAPEKIRLEVTPATPTGGGQGRGFGPLLRGPLTRPTPRVLRPQIDGRPPSLLGLSARALLSEGGLKRPVGGGQLAQTVRELLERLCDPYAADVLERQSEFAHCPVEAFP
jgi:hypothetical protein